MQALSAILENFEPQAHSAGKVRAQKESWFAMFIHALNIQVCFKNVATFILIKQPIANMNRLSAQNNNNIFV